MRRSRWLAAVRLLTAALGAAWVVWDRKALDQPVLAVIGLGAVAASAWFCWRPPARRDGLLEAATSGVAALLLVGLNGGSGSPLVAIWLAVLGSVCLTLPPQLTAQLPTLAVSALAIGIHPASTEIPMMLGAYAVAAGSFAVSRRYEQVLLQAQLESLHDPLTALPNRRLLDQRLTALEDGPLALLWVDLDGFRDVNNTHGYAVGDQVLVDAAQALLRVAPASSAARLGGDEFAIVLENRALAREVAERVIQEIAPLGASVGIAYLPEHGPSLDQLRANADQALRWAKQRGKGIAVEYDPVKVTEHVDDTGDDVRRLWEEDRIDIVVQPIVDIQYGRVRSYETLSRFRVDGDGSPYTWFTRAEKAGLRVELELACLERALRLLPQRPFGTRLSVNASPELLTHPAARELLMEVADPEGVVIEVTENAVVEDYEHLREILAPLVERGMTVAVDDFGAGAANMRHVDALAPRYLKLDRSLVDGISADPRKSAMVEALVRYTWKTESQLVAEGVETTEDLQHLRKLGVGNAQGYVIAKPQPPWPTLDLAALQVMQGEVADRRDAAAIVTQSDAIGATEARELFGRDTHLAAVVLVDTAERVRALLTRSRLTIGAGDAALAIDLADTEPLLVPVGTARPDIVAHATARDAERRYDPILVVDESWRLVEAITIEELLQQLPSAASAS